MSVEPKLIQLAVIAAVGAWGVTGCIKPVVKGSAVAGVAGGAMSATIVGAIKAVIKKKSQSAIEDE